MQPDYSGTCNTAKSCTEYSQNICSALLQKEALKLAVSKFSVLKNLSLKNRELGGITVYSTV